LSEEDSALRIPFEGAALFIRGTKSTYILDTYIKDIDKYFSNYQLQDMMGVGHWLHAEKPQEFNDLVTKFLLSNQ
jgi:esterase